MIISPTSAGHSMVGNVRLEGRIAKHPEVDGDDLQPAPVEQVAHEPELRTLGVQGTHQDYRLRHKAPSVTVKTHLPG